MRVEDSLIASACGALLLALLFARPDTTPAETVARCAGRPAAEMPSTDLSGRCEQPAGEKRHAAR